MDDKPLLTVTDISISGSVALEHNYRMFLTAELFWANIYEADDDTYDTNPSEVMYMLTHPPVTVTTMPEYISYFEKYLDRLPGAFKTPTEEILIFMMPLNPSVTHAVTSQNPKTLLEAEIIATRFSSTLKDSIFREGLARARINTSSNDSSFTFETTSHKSPPTNNHEPTKDISLKQCTYCKKRGHLARVCRFRRIDEGEDLGSRDYYIPRKNKRTNNHIHRKSNRGFIDINQRPRS